jgi:Mrp family chromosome partitioning ATPase
MNVHTHFDLANGQTGISSPELWAGTTRLVGGEVPDEFRIIKWHMLARAQNMRPVGQKNPRAVLVTSARPHEGKTFVAHNLVASLALGDETDVTLIDTDFGNPGLPTAGFHGHHKGLLDVLANDDLDLRSAFMESNKPQVHLLPAGRPRANIPELLNSRRMHALLDDITSNGTDNLVIVDGGAVLANSEPSRLAQFCGHILFVVTENKSRKEDIESALSLLDQLAGPIDSSNFSFVFKKAA